MWTRSKGLVDETFAKGLSEISEKESSTQTREKSDKVEASKLNVQNLSVSSLKSKILQNHDSRNVQMQELAPLPSSQNNVLIKNREEEPQLHGGWTKEADFIAASATGVLGTTLRGRLRKRKRTGFSRKESTSPMKSDESLLDPRSLETSQKAKGLEHQAQLHKMPHLNPMPESQTPSSPLRLLRSGKIIHLSSQHSETQKQPPNLTSGEGSTTLRDTLPPSLNHRRKKLEYAQTNVDPLDNGSPQSFEGESDKKENYQEECTKKSAAKSLFANGQIELSELSVVKQHYSNFNKNKNTATKVQMQRKIQMMEYQHNQNPMENAEPKSKDSQKNIPEFAQGRNLDLTDFIAPEEMNDTNSCHVTRTFKGNTDMTDASLDAMSKEDVNQTKEKMRLDPVLYFEKKYAAKSVISASHHISRSNRTIDKHDQAQECLKEPLEEQPVEVNEESKHCQILISEDHKKLPKWDTADETIIEERSETCVSTIDFSFKWEAFELHRLVLMESWEKSEIERLRKRKRSWNPHVWKEIKVFRDTVASDMLKNDIFFNTTTRGVFCPLYIKITSETAKCRRAAEDGADEGGISNEAFTLFFDQLEQVKVEDPEFEGKDSNNQVQLFERSNDGITLLPKKYCDINGKAHNLTKKLQGTYFAVGKILLRAILQRNIIPSAIASSILIDYCLGYDRRLVRKPLHMLMKELLAIDPAYQWVFTMLKKATRATFGEILLTRNDRTLKNDIDKRDCLQAFIKQQILEPRAQQLNCITEGFTAKGQVNISPFLEMCSYAELKLLISGDEELTSAKIWNTLSFANAFSPQHRTIEYLRQVLHDMSPKELRLFLKFATGLSAIPQFLGETIEFKIIIQSFEDARIHGYPLAHTCAKQIDLPAYTTKRELEERLSEAIQPENAAFTLI